MRAVVLSLLATVAGISACSDKTEHQPQTNGATAVSEDLPEAERLLVLDWDDLLPEGEHERLIKLYEDFYADLEQRRYLLQPTLLSEAGTLGDGTIEEGSSLDSMPQLGTFATVEELDGRQVEIPGFAVPLDMTGQKISAFLIVPYFGACIHTPPPAPNQIVYVTAEPAQNLSDLYLPQWFRGVLETARQDTDIGNAAYTLRLESVRPYE